MNTVIHIVLFSLSVGSTASSWAVCTGMGRCGRGAVLHHFQSAARYAVFVTSSWHGAHISAVPRNSSVNQVRDLKVMPLRVASEQQPQFASIDPVHPIYIIEGPFHL